MKRDVFYNRLIMDTLEENGHNVISFNGNTVTAKVNGFQVSISHERCSCHGGRLSIYAEHCGYNRRLESSTYDESKGVFDEDSELEYRIKNEMLSIIYELKEYIYAYEKISKYDKPENRKYLYFKSDEEMTRTILGNTSNIKSIFALDEPFKRTFPNPDIYEMIEPIKFENGIIEVIVRRFDRGNEDKTYDTYKCYVFNKLRK